MAAEVERIKCETLARAFPDDIIAVLDVLGDGEVVQTTAQIAADASCESGIAILPARCRQILIALRTLDVVDFGYLISDDDGMLRGKGYWLNARGKGVRTVLEQVRSDRGAA